MSTNIPNGFNEDGVYTGGLPGQQECVEILERLWEPRKSIPFSERTPRDGEISNLLCSFADGYLFTEDELKPIRDRILKLIEWKK